jgi:hypothetical protein
MTGHQKVYIGHAGIYSVLRRGKKKVLESGQKNKLLQIKIELRKTQKQECYQGMERRTSGRRNKEE